MLWKKLRSQIVFMMWLQAILNYGRFLITGCRRGFVSITVVQCLYYSCVHKMLYLTRFVIFVQTY